MYLNGGGSYHFFIGHGVPFSLKIKVSLYFRVCICVCVRTCTRVCVLGVAIVRKVRGFCFSHNSSSGDKQFDRWCGFTKMSSTKEPAFFCCLHYICSLPCVCVWASPPGSKMVALFITSGVEKKKVKCKGAKLSPTPLFWIRKTSWLQWSKILKIFIDLVLSLVLIPMPQKVVSVL